VTAVVVQRYPNAALVLERLLGRILGTEDHSAASLPTDQSKWAASGFVTYTDLGGSADIDLPNSRSAFGISCWATTGSGNASVAPPWAKAYDLAQTIDAALRGVMPPDFYQPHATRTNYLPHRIITAYPTTLPMAVRNDPSGFARVDQDLIIDWVAVP
jgi:hypothetical protein